MIAAGVVGLLSALLLGGFVINLIGQVSGYYQYNIPPEIVEIIKHAIGASLTVLSLGAIAEYRGRGECDHEDFPRIEEKHSDVVDVEPLAISAHRESSSSKLADKKSAAVGESATQAGAD